MSTTDDNPSSNPASQPVQETTNEAQPTTESPKEISPKSVFVNSQPIREDQVQNAVKFLSHPRVKGSPVVHRRNFLERKGLTKEEIDEAFRRVPDQAPTGANGQTTTYLDTNATSATSVQTHAPPVQAMQPMSTASSGALSTPRRKFHWSHAVYLVGFFAISGAGTALLFTKTIIPRFKSWIRRVVSDEEVVLEQKIVIEDAAKAAKSAAAAATDLAKMAESMLNSKDEEKNRFMDFMNNLLDTQTQEIRSMRTSIARLEGQLYSAGRNPVREEYIYGSVARSMQPLDNRSGFDKRSVRSASPLPSAEAPHPKSYMEIMAMVQRGERPPNVREIDDRPPNPNQPISNPSLIPRAKPWEVPQTTTTSNFMPQHQVPNDVNANYMPQDNGGSHQLNTDGGPSPWWEQNNGKTPEIEKGNAPMVESVSNRTVNIDNPPHQRRWVPPQPPPVAIPEAAVAIRQPKSAPKEVNPAINEEAQPVNEVDELQRITKMSEFGGQLETSGGSGSSEMRSGQIEEEQVY